MIFLTFLRVTAIQRIWNQNCYARLSSCTWILFLPFLCHISIIVCMRYLDAALWIIFEPCTCCRWVTSWFWMSGWITIIRSCFCLEIWSLPDPFHTVSLGGKLQMLQYLFLFDWFIKLWFSMLWFVTFSLCSENVCFVGLTFILWM